MKHLKSVLLGLVLAGCSTTAVAPEKIKLEAECVSPAHGTIFKYTDFTETSTAGLNLLVLTNKETVVYYPIPTGVACRVQPENKNNNDQVR